MKVFLTFVIVMLVFAHAHAANGKYYRYTESNGTVVIKSTISPERAALGYEVLDANGRLLNTIAPALTGDELADYLRQQAHEEKLQQEAKKQEEYDIALLQRYSFVADIEAEKKRQIVQLHTRTAILRGNLSSFRSDLEKTYEQVARYERQNSNVPENLKKHVANLEDKISATEDMIKAQSKEVSVVEQDYQKAIDRFKQLEELRGRKVEDGQQQ